MKRIYQTLLFLAVLLGSAPALAGEHYSFETAERLKPLIDWRSFGASAFDEAIAENKPIFLLLTAPSWCHWCQVYESEDFLFDPRVYTYINQNFIPIYVDADRRQDLTRQYLEGGWPSTTLMTPSRERIWGFSGVRAPATMLANFEKAVDYINVSGFSSKEVAIYKKSRPITPTAKELRDFSDRYVTSGRARFDSVFGGFGTGRKFPQPRMHLTFLDRYEETGDETWLQMVETTLENQYTNIGSIRTNYNLYDPVFGGWHRYGTARGYTPPHFEKMLFDNAKLLELYARLADLTGDDLAKEVTEGTFSWMRDWFYDSKRGGFYGNTDAYTELQYFGQADRDPAELRVEKTKYTDWNSDAIIALLSIKSPESQSMAEKTLAFFLENMIDENGPYHYMSPEGDKGTQGNLLDSATLLVAAAEGNQIEGARRIADFALANLYDWHSGGFFERNSNDLNLYPADELRILEKPLENNAFMTYGLVRLYIETEDLRYLNAAVKTMGRFVDTTPWLDSGYFFYRAAQLIEENDLLTVYEENAVAIAAIDRKGQEDFFIFKPTQPSRPDQPYKSSFVPVQEESDLQGPLLLLLIIAFLAGILSLLSPCTLPILPAYAAVVLTADRKKQVLTSASFIAGLSLVFALLGMSATTIGIFLKQYIEILTQLTGIVIFLIGLAAIAGLSFRGFTITHSQPKGTVAGAFFFGCIVSLSWTACIGPTLVAILVLASTLQTSAQGGVLLVAYAWGLGVPFALLSGWVQRAPRDGKTWKLLRGKGVELGPLSTHTTSLIIGTILVILGYLIYSGSLTNFNQYFTALPFQQTLFSIEDRLLQLLGP